SWVANSGRKRRLARRCVEVVMRGLSLTARRGGTSGGGTFAPRQDGVGAAAMLSLPHLFTFSRIVAGPALVAPLWWPEWEGGYLAAFALYCLMGVTDYFDGYLARASGTVSKLGIFLDPIADKIMVASVLLMLTANEDIRGWHVIAALVILIREIAVSGLREFLA